MISEVERSFAANKIKRVVRVHVGFKDGKPRYEWWAVLWTPNDKEGYKLTRKKALALANEFGVEVETE